MTNCIEIRGLVKQYKSFTLGPIDLKVPGGSIMGLIGENGAGKTTLIKSMLGIVKPTAGTAVLLGADPDRAKEDIGMVLDDCFFSEYLRVRDVETVLCRVFKTWDKGLYRDYLDKFGLSGAKNIKELSRGMRMKLSLAAALAHRPRLLLMDEPTGGLDPMVRGEVLDLFQDFIQDEDHGILFSSHITSDLEKVADYITFVDKGQALLVEEKDTLVEVYGVLKGPAAGMDRVAPGDAIGLTATPHGFEGLVRDKAEAAKRYPDFVVDRANLEEIILFLTRESRERSNKK